MQTGYFSAAWQDLKNSPGWFGKILLLALVSLIPVFGWIVVAGYLYGWARDIAWGVHAPMPAHIFGNEDGKLYSRGFFILVIAVVCSLIPWVIDLVGSIATGGWYGVGHYRGGGFTSLPFGMLSGVFSMIFFVLSLAASVFATLFTWIGSMRTSIYGRLSAGFQFGKMWSMLRHDVGGMLRILGMTILLGIGVWIVTMILIFFVVFVSIVLGAFATGGNMNINASHPSGALVGMIFGIGGVAFIFMVLAGFVAMAVSIMISAIVARAVGYWTRQFDVPAWRGQDDPMPFELMGPRGGMGGSGQPPYQQPPLQR